MIDLAFFCSSAILGDFFKPIESTLMGACLGTPWKITFFFLEFLSSVFIGDALFTTNGSRFLLALSTSFDTVFIKGFDKSFSFLVIWSVLGFVSFGTLKRILLSSSKSIQILVLSIISLLLLRWYSRLCVADYFYLLGSIPLLNELTVSKLSSNIM